MNTLKMPHPGDTKDPTLSQRMENMSYLFGLMHHYTAEGTFKSMAREVQAMEAMQKRMADLLMERLRALDTLDYKPTPTNREFVVTAHAILAELEIKQTWGKLDAET
jgi:hypothetical protein